MNWGGGAFCKKTTGKCGGGCFFVKKWTFPQRRVHYVQYQFFKFYILLIWGEGVRTHPTHPPPAYGPELPTSLSCLADRSVTLTDGRESVHGTRTENSWGSIYDIQCSLIS